MTLDTGSLPEGRALCGYPEPNPLHLAPGLGALCAAQCPRCEGSPAHQGAAATRGPGAAVCVSLGHCQGRGDISWEWLFPLSVFKKAKGRWSYVRVGDQKETLHMTEWSYNFPFAGWVVNRDGKGTGLGGPHNLLDCVVWKQISR